MRHGNLLVRAVRPHFHCGGPIRGMDSGLARPSRLVGSSTGMRLPSRCACRSLICAVRRSHRPREFTNTNVVRCESISSRIWRWIAGHADFTPDGLCAPSLTGVPGGSESPHRLVVSPVVADCGSLGHPVPSPCAPPSVASRASRRSLAQKCCRPSPRTPFAPAIGHGPVTKGLRRFDTVMSSAGFPPVAMTVHRQCSCEELRGTLRRVHRRRKPYALCRPFQKVIETLKAQRQMRPPFRAGDRMHLIHDHGTTVSGCRALSK